MLKKGTSKACGQALEGFLFLTKLKQIFIFSYPSGSLFRIVSNNHTSIRTYLEQFQIISAFIFRSFLFLLFYSYQECYTCKILIAGLNHAKQYHIHKNTYK